jgi:hypothetical protein
MTDSAHDQIYFAFLLSDTICMAKLTQCPPQSFAQNHVSVVKWTQGPPRKIKFGSLNICCEGVEQ